MAVSIDTVYQRVLALANKEQRGYITPQEFNLLANQAQMTIFESYFYEKNRSDKSEDVRADDTETSISKLLDAKLRPFTTATALVSGSNGYWVYPEAYQIGLIYFNGVTCKKVSQSDLVRYAGSKRHISLEPIYADSTSTSGDVRIYNNGSTVVSGSVVCDAVTKPNSVTWGYVVINDKALYNANTTTDFELHDSEEDTLVNRVLGMAGIVINKVGLVQTISQKNLNEQQLQTV
jgi:hypothetical protein